MIKEQSPLVVIIDDEVSLCSLLEIFFVKKGYRVQVAHNLREAQAFLEGTEPLLAMVDLSLGLESGLVLVKKFRQKFTEMPVIVMTAYGTVENAVEVMKLGAFDFLPKPFEMQLLSDVVQKVVLQRNLKRENANLKTLLRREGMVELVGNSPVIHQLREKIYTLAESDSTVLITGESGTGKEVVAKLIHQCSKRSQGPFVVVNCSALSESLLESELFGHVKGAFTSANSEKDGLFYVASGGSVFLDEIGEMPLRTQVKLLRVLQEREITPVGGTVSQNIDVRILAATNVELERAVEEGQFREDLYYRLNVIRLHIPPLDDRPGDVVLLANYFLEKNTQGGKRFGGEALKQIQNFSWPGNVRQLENAVERAIAFSKGDLIEQLELEALGASSSFDRSDEAADGPVLLTGNSPTMIEIEKAYIHWILTQSRWHKPSAAKILGLDISTLYRKIEKYGFKNN